MIGAVRDFVQGFLGRGEATITVPSFDGALKPNQALERCETLATLEEPEDLALAGDALLVADGRKLMRWREDGLRPLREFAAAITALCGLPGGGYAVALDGREVQLFEAPDAGAPKARFAGSGMRAVNALSPDGAGGLFATDGSAKRDCRDWTWDLMERGRSGRLLRLEPASQRVGVIASGMRYAFGVTASEGRALVSESWRHRLISFGSSGDQEIALTHLPVYPSRLTPALGGGFWLTAFAARTLLVEFVLREPAYRKRMMAEIAPEHWIAPRLASGASFFEPMQGAHLKTMGVVKPWAPPRSYGLVIRLDARARPLFSLHSRFDGHNHGVVSALENNGSLYLIAKGPKRLLRLPIEGLAQEYTA